MEKLMTMFMYLLGIFWIIIGTLSIFVTDLARKKFFAKLFKKANLKRKAAIAFIIGILLLLSSPYNRNALLIILLGLLAILKGVMFMVAQDRVEKVEAWWLKANDTAYRILGVVIIIFGSIVLTGI